MRRDEVGRNEPDSGVFALVEMARTALGQLSHEQCLRGELETGRRTKRDWANSTSRHWQTLAILTLAFLLIGAVLVVFRHVIWPDALSYVVEIESTNKAQLTQPIGTSSLAVRNPDGAETKQSPSSRTKLSAAPKSKISK